MGLAAGQDSIYVKAVILKAMKIFRWILQGLLKTLSAANPKILVKQTSSGCREIAFCPVGHF